MGKHIYRGEALVKRWGESSNAGRTVTLEIDGEGPHPFKGYEGERFAVVIMPIGNDEQPMEKAPPKERKRWNEMRVSARAAMLTKDAAFQTYTKRFGYDGTEADADRFVKTKCNIESKRDLDVHENWPNQRMFEDMEGNFRAYQQAQGHGVAA